MNWTCREPFWGLTLGPKNSFSATPVVSAAAASSAQLSASVPEREWAPGEAEATLRAQLFSLGLTQQEADGIVKETLYAGTED